MSEVRSALVWERGSMGLSPLTATLQQLTLEKKQLVMALVCEGEEGGACPQLPAGYVCESMVSWFHGKLLGFCKDNPGADGKRMEELIRRQWDYIWDEWKEYGEKKGYGVKIGASGIVLWDNHFVAFGNRPVYVLNCRFNKPRKKNILTKERSMAFASGEIHTFASIYLENQVFAEVIKEAEIVESLYTEKLMEEVRLEKRLCELISVGKERSGGKSMGAVVLEVMPC